MKFSEFFDLETTKADDWYDIVLTLDVKFFIDPFLIYSSEFGEFIGSHNEVISFFNEVFKLIAKSNGDPQSTVWSRAQNRLLFPEADEFCLGYTTAGTKGAGSGAGFAKIISSALWEAVQAGVKNISHFEEIGLFREGIGADRISDITATLLRHRFATYTKNVCDRHEIPTKPRKYLRGIYDTEFDRWASIEYELPLNPYNDRPILLAPKKYIRDLPTINANDFWDYCYTNDNEIIRDEFGADITKNVDKATIVRFAARHPELREEYIKQAETDDPTPYDFDNDPKGYHFWYYEAAKYCKQNPVKSIITTKNDFKDIIESFIKEFSNFVENNRGWKLLWSKNGRPRSEEATQLLFLGIVKHYCKANNIDISREVNIGRGPVDFKVSQGHEFRALLELKLAKNTKFWRGITKQLPKYQEAENVEIGYFIVIAYNERDVERVRGVQEKVNEINALTGYDISTYIVDARQYPESASKL